MSIDFTSEQKRYLEGFAFGIQSSRPMPGGAASAEPVGPDAAALKAQAQTEAAGKKLTDPEKWKRDEHPFDAYPRLVAQAANDQFPKPPDNFRWRYHGLFYVGPAQDSYMCRMRIPNGILTHWQFAGVADLADRCGGGYTHVTTRANLQIREIPARHGVQLIEGLQELGLGSRGAGADNIRNVTGDATAGIGPGELLDTRPYAKSWHFHILNDRSLYGLPRKFNVAFDGGGSIPTLEDTNDIGFQAVEVLPSSGLEPGVYFRLALGGISGHKDLARDTGVVLAPADANGVADAVLRVFVEEGDRTNRTKARLKYVLDRWGFDKYIAAVEERFGRKLLRVDAAHVAPRPVHDRFGHVGVHPQKQAGLSFIGVSLNVGRMDSAAMRALATVARTYGDGDIRLTVWQNLLISGVPDAKVAEACAAIHDAGFATEASSIRAGLVACTGSQGCKFAASDTKSHADAIARHVEATVALDTPVNVHVTGCHNSCAQHYIGDIGLIGARVAINDEGDTVDGYNMVVGGGFGAAGAIGRDFLPDVKATDAPAVVARLLDRYLERRTSADQTFHTYAASLDADALQSLAAEIRP